MSLQVRIASFTLPEDRAVSMSRSSTLRDAAKTRRANRERICWQIQDQEGHSMGVGMFYAPEAAARYCREHGWRPGGFPDGQ